MNGGRKISWVRWKSVCQPKSKGGLGVRDIRLVNLSLLAKWRWGILGGENSLWKDVLKEKYGDGVGIIVVDAVAVLPRYSSSWWKGLVKLEGGDAPSWFNNEVTRKVGNEVNTSFWSVAWRGEIAFRLKYPRLFSISNQKEASVADLGSGGEWVFGWRRRFFQWEEEMLLLLEDLEGFVWTPGEEDRWRWKLSEDGAFTVKSTYGKLVEVMLVEDRWHEEERKVFGSIWKSPAPLKVIVFSW